MIIFIKFDPKHLKLKLKYVTIFTRKLVILLNNKLSNLIITKVFSATTMYNETGAGGKRTDRSNWAVLIRYEGKTVYTQGSRKIISNINNPVILPKGVDYEWKCTESGHYTIIEFQSELESKQIFSFNIKQQEKILNIFKKIENSRLLKNNFYQIESIKDTYKIILMLNEQNSLPYVSSGKKQILRPVVEYIVDNYTKKLSNDALAKITGLSTPYFRRIFKEVYGISPLEYAKDLRIKKAKEMLHSDYGNITDIAFTLGYQNIYDFSRDFKKHTGISPSKYIKQK